MINNKHVLFFIGDTSFLDYSPKFFIDFYKLKPRTRYPKYEHYSFTFILGIGDKCVHLELKWGYVK